VGDKLRRGVSVWCQVGLAMLLSLILPGCGPLRSRQPTPVPVEIRFAYGIRQLEPYYEKAKAEFETAHQGVTVTLSQMSPYEMLFRGAGSADAVEIEQLAISTLAEQGVLRPLEASVQGPDGIDLDSFYPGTVDAVRWRGQLWALPSGVDPALLYYNRDIFDAKGVTYPTNDWTWDDLLLAAQRIAEPDADPPLYGVVSDPRRLDFLPLVYQGGGSLVDSEVDPTSGALSSMESLAALQWYVDLALVHRVMPTPGQLAAGSGMQVLVISQRAAMWYGSLSERGGLSWDARWPFDWGAVAQPAGRQRATLLTIRAYAINAQSEEPRVAWEWIKFLVQYPGRQYDLPAWGKAALEDSLSGESPELIAAVRRALQDGQSLPPLAWRINYFMRLVTGMESVLRGSADLTEVAAQVDQQLSEALQATQ